MATDFFEQAVGSARRGFDRAGLARALGDDPLARRVQAPFGRDWASNPHSSRETFTASSGLGLWGAETTRGGFSTGGGLPEFEWGQYGIQYDPTTGLRVKAGAGNTTGTPGPGNWGGGGLSANGATHYDKAFIGAATEMSRKYGVNLDPAVLKAMATIESGGTFGMPVRPTDAYGGGASVGMMQIKPEYWGGLAAEIGADIWDPVGNIRTAAALMAQTMATNGGSWERAIREVYHPADDPGSGFTRDKYIATVNQLVQQYGAPGEGGSSWSGTTSGSGWQSVFGPAGTPISYEFDAPSVNGDMYNYAASSGLSGWSHPGIDVSVPRNTPLYSPGSGTVSCVGSADAGIGGTGGGSCGYFGDTDGGGVGNVTIRLDNGAFVILGHSAGATVQPGQRVSAGQQVATSGGMLGAPTHHEVRVPDAATASGYRIVDPRSVLGGGGAASWSGGHTPITAPAAKAQNGIAYTPGFQITPRLRR